ncbi:hypothetical protein J132_07794 [Termitomyces sp. J132]|nr:hypothetical protein J132_07794 [Termitomyces sp. J132]
MKVKKSVSIRTAQQWLHKEGFQFIGYKKGLYFDGHDQPDVLEYQNKVFLPQMKDYFPCLICYTVGNVDTPIIPQNFVECPLVLVAQDEMTAQAHDTVSKSWVLDDQHKLRKKGVGCGLHQSDVICSIVECHHGPFQDCTQQPLTPRSSVKPATISSTLWSCPVVEKIIPAFERAHRPGYQALFMVDNSQGHSAYAEDALVANHMNVNPGGKQAHLQDGWYEFNGQRITQKMVFPHDHPEYPDMPKGLHQVLTERGIDTQGLCGKCKNKCKADTTACCCLQILSNQPDFKLQKSLVQEIIEAEGHLCILLPKFHCELNFIEFFWGAVKKYLHDHCDMTFENLKINMPQALASVQIATIRKWEHHMHWWMEAYREGLGTQDAQAKIKEFSSIKYKSHRRVPETVAQTFDV